MGNRALRPRRRGTQGRLAVNYEQGHRIGVDCPQDRPKRSYRDTQRQAVLYENARCEERRREEALPVGLGGG